MRQKGAEWRPRGHVSNKALSGSGCCRPLCVITTRLQLHMVYIRACTLIYTLFVQYTICCLCFTRRMLDCEDGWGCPQRSHGQTVVYGVSYQTSGRYTELVNGHTVKRLCMAFLIKHLGDIRKWSTVTRSNGCIWSFLSNIWEIYGNIRDFHRCRAEENFGK